MAKPAKQCDQCISFNMDVVDFLPLPVDQLCEKHHRPKFYLPRSPMCELWGWKRRCSDFEPYPTQP